MRALLVEKHDGDAAMIANALVGATAPENQLTRVATLAKAVERLETERFDVLLVNLALPDAAGLEGLHRLRIVAPNTPIIMLAAPLDADMGLTAIQHGAHDYLEKGRVQGNDLKRAVRFTLERAQHEGRTRLFYEVSTALNGARDPERMMSAVRVTLIRGYADWCSVHGAATTDTTPRPANADAAPRPKARASRIFTPLTPPAADDPDRPILEDLVARGLHSAILAPFSAQGWEQGVLIFARQKTSPPYNQADLTLADEIVRKAVVAIEYATVLATAKRDRERAEVAGRARDEFLATLSHELRTPLNAILGWTTMLRSSQVPSEMQPKALETIERNARSQVALIDDALEVSRIITGKVRLAVRAIDVAQVIANATETLRPVYEAKGVTLAGSASAGVGTVQADPDRLLQILLNLLSNAVRFTPKGGRVSVRTQRQESSIDIAVSDTGQGIPPELLPHIFDRFRQGDASLTRTHGGLRLGLAIARHLVELHGGSIRAESSGIGRGSTFFVRLPLSPVVDPGSVDFPIVRPSPLPGHAIKRSTLAGLTVLVVDDDPDTRVLLTAVLEFAGAAVTTASSVDEGMAALRKTRPSVVVSDIGMPGASGYDFIRRVRALKPEEGGRTPAVALTAFTRMEDRKQALSLGFNHHVSKPITPEDLVAVISTFTGGRDKG